MRTDAPIQQQRWLDGVSIGSNIPPFGAVYVNSAGPLADYTQRGEDRLFVYEVGSPGSFIPELLDPNDPTGNNVRMRSQRIGFAGETGIRAGEVGVFTLDTPAVGIVLHTENSSAVAVLSLRQILVPTSASFALHPVQISDDLGAVNPSDQIRGESLWGAFRPIMLLPHLTSPLGSVALVTRESADTDVN